MKVDTESKVSRHDHRRERAILVGLLLPDRPASYQQPLEELERLADTAGADTLDRFVQKREKPDPRTFLGKGKAVEVGERMKELEADIVVVDHDLTSSQARNLEKVVGGRVVDRTELILDIFVRRASSAMAKAQVELAQMEYSLPRLKSLWTHLDREGGGGIGVRGPGEKQIETDRRLVRKRIRDLKRSLKTMHEHKIRQSEGRSQYLTVSIVGYTNAGKSTLLRALTGADVFVQDRLFATLDTTTRAWEIAPGKRVFLSDTVGFIRDLPHHLVQSFQATLEEARSANLLLHIVDAADPDVLDHIDVVEQTLYDIGAGSVPRLSVLNQMDRVRDPLAFRLVEERLPDAVRTSAKTGEGLEALREAVLAYVTRHDRLYEVEADAGDGRLVAHLRTWGEIIEERFEGDRLLLQMRLPKRHAEQARREGATLRPLENRADPVAPDAKVPNATPGETTDQAPEADAGSKAGEEPPTSD